MGRATEVTRDELKFFKFVVRLRARFAELFNQILEKQLVLKGIMTIEEWLDIKNRVKYDFAKDNYFTELKNAEIMQNRVALMGAMEQANLFGRFYSYEWGRRNVLHQADDDIEKQDEQIELEAQDPRWDGAQDPDADQERQQGPDAQSAAGSRNEGGDSNRGPDPEKVKAIKEARQVIKKMEERGTENRSIQDEAKYKSALQVIAKNSALLKKWNI
jgi:hypothetical protein